MWRMSCWPPKVERHLAICLYYRLCQFRTVDLLRNDPIILSITLGQWSDLPCWTIEPHKRDPIRVHVVDKSPHNTTKCTLGCTSKTTLAWECDNLLCWPLALFDTRMTIMKPTFLPVYRIR